MTLDDDDLDFGLPAPPPAPVREADDEPRGSAPPAALVDLGIPPTDPLECQAYMYRCACVLIHETMMDPSLSAADRRREVRLLMATAKTLVPEAKLWEAVQEIRQDRAQLEERRRAPKLELVPEPGARPR